METLDLRLAEATRACDDHVDVVIPVYNGSAYIGESISSVLSQTLSPRRVIVVDDGSTDETAAVVSALAASQPTIVLHRLAQNSGESAARNAGIRLSDSRFIAFLDADDVWAPEKLALQMAIFKSKGSSVGFVNSSYYLMNERGELLVDAEVIAPSLRGKVLADLLRRGNILSGSASSVLVRREVLDRAGLFDERLYYGGDWDMWLRLAAISEVDYVPEALVGIRVHRQSAQSQSIRRDVLGLFNQTLLIYDRWHDLLINDVAFLSRLRKEGCYALLVHARSLGQVEAFYRSLKTSNQKLAQALFSSRLQLWTGLLWQAAKGCLRYFRNGKR